jgi:hypothetical protein
MINDHIDNMSDFANENGIPLVEVIVNLMAQGHTIPFMAWFLMKGRYPNFISK